jgi:hypothetical protein
MVISSPLLAANSGTVVEEISRNPDAFKSIREDITYGVFLEATGGKSALNKRAIRPYNSLYRGLDCSWSSGTLSAANGYCCRMLKIA